jgi:hypothetical protein
MRNREKYPDMPIWQAIMMEDDYDHRLGARAMRSTVAPTAPNFTGSFFGSFYRKSRQDEGQDLGQGRSEGQGVEAEAEVELAAYEAEVKLAQLADEGDEKA